jgi:hypothetical protein
MLQLASTVILIAVGAPFSLPALLVMMGLFWALYRYFIASMRQAKRLEAVSRWGCVCVGLCTRKRCLRTSLDACCRAPPSVMQVHIKLLPATLDALAGVPASLLKVHPAAAAAFRSPVLSNVNEAIHGAATIRAFGITDWLIGRNMVLVNKNAATSLLNQSLNRWGAAMRVCLELVIFNTSCILVWPVGVDVCNVVCSPLTRVRISSCSRACVPLLALAIRSHVSRLRLCV